MTKKKKLLISLTSALGIIVVFFTTIFLVQFNSTYFIEVNSIDGFSPDRILTVKRGNSEVSDIKEIRFTDGVLLCEGNNLAVSVHDLTGEEKLIVTLNDGKEIEAILKEVK